ncbi:MAG TPA: LCP family protein [Mobilitalea sp.]|nr:LCP family protein [Mobilitalea sp.]
MQDNYDIDTDPDFDANFYKNIEKALSNIEAGGDLDKNIEAVANEGVVFSDLADGVDKDDPITEGINPGDGLEAYTQEDMAAGVDDELVDINASLARQISEELMNMDNTSKTVKKKMTKKVKIQCGVLIALLCLVSFAFFLGFTNPGNKILMKMGVDLGGKIWETWTKDFEKDPLLTDDTDYLDEEDLNSDANEIDPSTIIWTDHPGEGMYKEGVYNILLLGEEAIGSGSARGRTDLIIIATLNSKAKEVKLTSLMRDTLVQIPGYKENKLNTAYEKGGLDLLYETIALNFDIKLDGCVMVNFENFEKIIDKIGGIEIELTSSEAKYLRNTNYISKPQYRDVVEGKQLMNGNQVLGYTRVRKRANINGANNDYGRTERHRIVLEAIFDKYKTKGKIELASMMLSILPMIKTDINSNNFELLLNTFIEMGTTKMDQLRIPADGTFTDNVKVRSMDVLIPDLEKNVDILHDFIFGE